MKLYYSPGACSLSPHIALLEAGLAFEPVLASTKTHRLPDGTDYYAINPLGRIPALKDGDCTLADSSVICQYLEEAYPATPPLYGDSAQARGQVRWLEKYANYELAPLTTFTVFRNRILKPTSGQPCNEEAVQTAMQQKLPPHFDYLEQQLGDNTDLI